MTEACTNPKARRRPAPLVPTHDSMRGSDPWARVCAALCLFATILSLCGGCTALSAGNRSTETLSDEDQRMVKALAHYAHGRLLAAELDPTHEAVLAEFEAALRLDPNRKRIYSHLVRAYHKRSNLDRAIELLESAARANPNLAETHKALGHLCDEKGYYESAIKHFRRTLKLEPTDEDTYIRLATTYFEATQDDKAIDSLSRAIQLDNDPADVLAQAYYWAKRFIETKEKRRAIPCFDFIVSHYPEKRGEFYFVLGQLYESLQLPAEARQNYAHAGEQDPPYLPAMTRLAELLWEDDKPEKAKAILTTVLTHTPNDYEALFRLAAIHYDQKDYAPALALFARVEETAATRTPPDILSPEFYLHYGAACERAGRRDKAETVFLACLESYPDADEVLNYLAYMWAEEGKRLEDAQRFIQTALLQEPDNGAYLDTLGWIYYKQKKYDAALATVTKALAVLTDDPVIRDHLGDIYAAMKQPDRAVEQWTKSYLMDSSQATVGQKLTDRGIDLTPLKKEAARMRQALESKSDPREPRE